MDFNSNVDFSKFKTYAWLESKHPAKGLWPQRITDGVGRELQAKGLKIVDMSQNPDLEVVYNSGVKERTTVEGYNYGYGYGPRWGWGGPSSPTYQLTWTRKPRWRSTWWTTRRRRWCGGEWRGIRSRTVRRRTKKAG